MNRTFGFLAAAALAAAALAAPAAVAQVARVDASIPAYQKTSGVSGNLNSVGSDTMNNLMTLWGESFAKLYPNVKIQVEGKGSSPAPPALIKAPGKELDPVVREFLKFVFSREGQEIVVKDGYYPLPAKIVQEELAKLR